MKRKPTKKACRECRFIVTEGSRCPNCGSTSLTTKWSGYIYVLKIPSRIAEMIDAKREGEYAVIVE